MMIIIVFSLKIGLWIQMNFYPNPDGPARKLFKKEHSAYYRTLSNLDQALHWQKL
jgi:hypothetical protein